MPLRLRTSTGARLLAALLPALFPVLPGVVAVAATPWDDAAYQCHLGTLEEKAATSSRLQHRGPDVQIGVALAGPEREASLARGGDGQVASFKAAGWLASTLPDLPAGQAMTYCLRVRPARPGGLWHTSRLSLVLHESGLAVAIMGMVDDRGRMNVEVPLSPLRLNEWQDVILRHDGKSLEFIVNGEIRNRIDLVSGAPQSVIPGPLLIGSWRMDKPATVGFPQGPVNWLYERPLAGEVDHLGIWSRMLTDGEVAYLCGTASLKPLPPETSPAQRCLANYREFIHASRGGDMARCEALGLAMRTFMAGDLQRPVYHLTAPMDVIFDPAGAFHHEGKYHVFSYRNLVSLLGSTPLAHYVSEDLIHWRDQPIAVWADSPLDVQGIWLGNIFLDDQKQPRMLYTALGEQGKIGVLARSRDGLRTFCDKKAVMTGMMHHDGHTWKEGDTWYSITTRQHWGRRAGDVGDGLHLLKSSDLERWTDLGEFFHVKKDAVPHDDNQRWGVTEFPYLVPFGEKHALIVGTRPTRYWIGRLDVGKPAFIPDEPESRLLDHLNPFHCFNPSIVDQRGPGGTERRVVLAMNRFPAGSVEGIPWYGIHVLPRVLSLEGNHLRQEPVPEVERLRGRHHSVGRTPITPGATGPLPGISGDTLEVIATFEPGAAQRLGLKVRVNAKSGAATTVYYDVKTRRFGVEGGLRSFSSYPDMGHGPTYLKEGETVTLRVFLDRSVIEVFANGQTMNGVLASAPEAAGLDVFSEGGEAMLASLDAWEMKPAFPTRASSPAPLRPQGDGARLR